MKLKGWPKPLQEAVQPYISTGRRGPTRSSYGRKEGGATSYWYQLPSWLGARYRMEPTLASARSGLFARVVDAQHQIYLFVRIQDDLFDGQAKSPLLIYSADQLLFEAEELLVKLVPKDSRFWLTYWDCLRSTTRSIVEVDELQRNPLTRSAQLLKKYARVCSIFKIATAALCALAKRWPDFAQLSMYCDEMAQAGQILDDLRDLGEDLKRERFNYVANVLYQLGSKNLRQGKPLDVIAQGIFVENGTKNIFGEIRRHVQRARRAIGPLNLPGAMEYLEDYRQSVESLAGRFHQTQVKGAYWKSVLSEGTASITQHNQTERDTVYKQYSGPLSWNGKESLHT